MLEKMIVVSSTPTYGSINSVDQKPGEHPTTPKTVPSESSTTAINKPSETQKTAETKCTSPTPTTKDQPLRKIPSASQQLGKFE